MDRIFHKPSPEYTFQRKKRIQMPTSDVLTKVDVDDPPTEESQYLKYSRYSFIILILMFIMMMMGMVYTFKKGLPVKIRG
jgi:hypothetical protein